MTKTRMRRLLLTSLFMVVMLAGLMIFTGESYAATRVRETDAVKASDGYEMILFEGDFIRSPKDKVLARINQIRKAACDNREADPRNTSKKLSPSDYVPIKWSSDLEWIAQTRAAESALYWEHDRPNGKGLEHNGTMLGAEILAAGSLGEPGNAVFDSISDWMFEHTYWTSGDYDWGGHYAELIDPGNKYVGLAAFIPAGCLIYYGAGALTSDEQPSEAQNGVKGRYLQKIEVDPSKLSVKSSQTVFVDKGKTSKIYLKAVSNYPNMANDKDADIFYQQTVVNVTGTGWKSKNTSIASVDSAGNVKGVKDGTVKMTAKFRNKEYTVTVNVVDVKKVTPAKVKIKKPKGGKNKFTVKWKKVAKKTKGYQINVWDSEGNDCGTLNVKKGKKKTLSKTFKGVPKGKYKVRVRAYNTVKGKKYYGPWSKFKTVKVK